MSDALPTEKRKLVVIGSEKTGKTQIVSRLVDDKFSETHLPTIGVDFMTTILQGKKALKAQVWDTSGQERFRSLMKSYIADAGMVLLVYDVTSEKSLEDVQSLYTLFEERLSKVPMLLFGNKADDPAGKYEAHTTAKEWVRTLSKQFPLPHHIVSARTGTSTAPLTKALLEQINERILLLGNSLSTGAWTRKKLEGITFVKPDEDPHATVVCLESASWGIEVPTTTPIHFHTTTGAWDKVADYIHAAREKYLNAGCPSCTITQYPSRTSKEEEADFGKIATGNHEGPSPPRYTVTVSGKVIGVPSENPKHVDPLAVLFALVPSTGTPVVTVDGATWLSKGRIPLEGHDIGYTILKRYQPGAAAIVCSYGVAGVAVVNRVELGGVMWDKYQKLPVGSPLAAPHIVSPDVLPPSYRSWEEYATVEGKSFVHPGCFLNIDPSAYMCNLAPLLHVPTTSVVAVMSKDDMFGVRRFAPWLVGNELVVKKEVVVVPNLYLVAVSELAEGYDAVVYVAGRGDGEVADVVAAAENLKTPLLVLADRGMGEDFSAGLLGTMSSSDGVSVRDCSLATGAGLADALKLLVMALPAAETPSELLQRLIGVYEYEEDVQAHRESNTKRKQRLVINSDSWNCTYHSPDMDGDMHRETHEGKVSTDGPVLVFRSTTTGKKGRVDFTLETGREEGKPVITLGCKGYNSVTNSSLYGRTEDTYFVWGLDTKVS